MLILYSSDLKFCFIKNIECPVDTLNFISDTFNKLSKFLKKSFSSGDILKFKLLV